MIYWNIDVSFAFRISLVCLVLQNIHIYNRVLLNQQMVLVGVTYLIHLVWYCRCSDFCCRRATEEFRISPLELTRRCKEDARSYIYKKILWITWENRWEEPLDLGIFSLLLWWWWCFFLLSKVGPTKSSETVLNT